MADGDIRVDRPPNPSSSRNPEPRRTTDPAAFGADFAATPSAVRADQSTTFVASAQPAAMAAPDDSPVSGAGSPSLGAPRSKMRRGDRVFAALTSGASGFVILLVALVAVFLLVQAVPSILDDKSSFLFSNDWSTSKSDLRFGVAALLYTTVLISVVALLIAVPIAMGIALFITQYAPRRLARPVGYVIDLLAAIPSIIYGVWGARILSPKLEPVQNFLQHLHVIPLFKGGFSTGTVFDGAIVLTVMILPIITAISRDVFDRTPTANQEAALALGATRWEMIRLAVLPYGRAGVVSGSMLGLGRALGETIAVYLILSKVSNFSPSLFSGGETFASKIAGSSDGFGQNPGPYVAAGLVLFVLTFIVNALARAIVNRRKEFV